MERIEADECLSALLVGLHFSKALFSISNDFSKILDEVSELENFHVNEYTNHHLSFNVGNISVSIKPTSVQVNSGIFFDKKLEDQVISTGTNKKKVKLNLPLQFFDSCFSNLIDNNDFVVGASSKNQKIFLDECSGMIKLVDKVVQGGLPKFSFAGMVKYYIVPLKYITWTILDNFTKEAQLDGAINTEKTAINRYNFPVDENGIRKCLIFKLVKPNEMSDDTIVGGANFDFQLIPEEVKSIDEFGGAKELIKSLAMGSEEVIKNSKFLEFS